MPATSSTLAASSGSRHSLCGPEGDEAALREAEILETAIEVAFRLGDSFARQLFDRIPADRRPFELSVRSGQSPGACLVLVGDFHHAGHACAYVSSSDGLLLEADELSAVTLEPLVSQCFRGLRKLGLHAENNRFRADRRATVESTRD